MANQNATDIRELLENNRQGVMTDLRQAETIELMAGNDGRIWLNIDGVCFLRVAKCSGVVMCDTSAREATNTLAAADAKTAEQYK